MKDIYDFLTLSLILGTGYATVYLLVKERVITKDNIVQIVALVTTQIKYPSI